MVAPPVAPLLMIRVPFVSLIALLVALLPAASEAQADSSARDSTARRLKTVTISSSMDEGIVGGASAVVIRPSELKSSPAPLLDQALRESPFIHVRQNSRGEMELSVRGSESRQAAVLLDGVPITLGWDSRTDVSVVPITGADRIVIVRGLGSLLNGPNSLGGSIEVTHDPLFQSNRWRGGLGVDENSALVGSLGAGWRVADVGGGALSIRGGLSYRQRDGVSLPDGVVDPTASNGLRTNSDLKEADGFTSLRWGNLAGRSVGFTISSFDARKGVPPEEGISEPRLWRYPLDRRTIGAFSASTGTVATPLGTGSIEVGAGINDGKLKIVSYTARDYATVDGTELGNERTTTLRALLSHSLGAATLRAGITTADVRYKETLPPAVPNDYRQKLRSAGVEVEAPLGSRTTVAAGFVSDHSETPETGGRTPGQKPFGANGWRLGLSRDLNSRFRLHASASQRSRFPALRELYSGALNRFQPNPDLKPESLLGLEGGVTMHGGLGRIPQATLAVTAFNHTLDDAVVRTTLPSRKFMRVNRDRFESRGVEMLAGLVFGTDRERSVTLDGDATLQRIAIFDKTANDAERHPENNPETMGRVELGVPLPWQMRVFAGGRHIGTTYCLNGDTGDEMTIASATTSDFAIQRTFLMRPSGTFRWLRAVLAMDNVGNTALYDSCGLPQPGRTLRIMMTFG